MVAVSRHRLGLECDVRRGTRRDYGTPIRRDRYDPRRGTRADWQALVIGKTFAIVPVTTELQRRLIYNAGPNSTVLLMVDASALFKDAKTLDVEAFPVSELRKGLTTFRPEKGKSVAHFQVHYAGLRDVSGDGSEVLDYVLQGVSRAAGFTPGTAAGFYTYHNDKFAFDEYVAPLKDDKGAGEIEAGVGDERARAYPVRTPLSRVLTQSVGGVVDVLTPLDCQGDNWVPDEVNKSVKAAIGKLKLAKGQRLNFLLNISKRDDRAQERIREACKRWAEDGGLESGSFSF